MAIKYYFRKAILGDGTSQLQQIQKFTNWEPATFDSIIKEFKAAQERVIEMEGLLEEYRKQLGIPLKKDNA